ncbi:MAG: hypothetical protein IT454_14100 [Planctomycetes bacterium]|nr:hypothetical protein [Planctomycetota bacterium]
MKSRVWAAAWLAATLLSSCLWRSTQRWPGPMANTVEPLPEGDAREHLPGPEEVSVVRHADPVQIRPVGALSGHPMAFYDKRARLTAGGAVIVSPGGRAEVLWPSGSSIVLFGEAVGWVGSTSRGDPMFELREVDRARLDLQAGDQVRLLGGAVLSGASGPYVLQRDPDQTLLVHNQSKASVQVAFREETFELGPGRAVRLPLLSSGGAPYVDDPQLQRFAGPGFNVRLLGALDCAEEGGGVRVRAAATLADQSEARALGVRVRLSAGESAFFSDPRPAPPAVQPLPAEPARTESPAPRP